MGTLVNHTERLPCIRCGYELRAASPGGRCPECDTPVALSSEGHVLACASPAWVRKLGAGMAVKLSAAAIAVASAVLLLIPAFNLWSDVARSALVLLIQGLLCWGTVLVTSPDPKDSFQEQGVGLRNLARWLTVVALVGRSLYEFPPMVLDPNVRAGGGTIVFVVATSASVLELRYLARLAKRVPNGRLGGAAGRLSWATAGTGAIGGVLGVHTLVGGGLGPYAFVAQAYRVLVGLCGLWYVAVIVRYFVAFVKAAKESEHRVGACGGAG